jgi:hypothetical protein
LRAAVIEAASTTTPWVWLVEDGTAPAFDALATLRAVAATFDDDSRPVLLASRITNDAGQNHPDAMPQHEVFEKERTLDATLRGLVHLRVAAPGSLLISTDALRQIDTPRETKAPGVDMRAWTARMLRRREDVGVLVPASTAIRYTPPFSRRQRRQRWAGRAQLLSGDAWSSTEKLWEAMQLTQQATAALTRRRLNARN